MFIIITIYVQEIHMSNLFHLYMSFHVQLSVDTLQFLLFLYLQQLNRVSLRTSLIGEEWPSPRSRSPSSSADREAKISFQNKVKTRHYF